MQGAPAGPAVNGTPDEQSPARPGDPETLLLVEDDPEDAVLVEEMLADSGLRATLSWARSLTEAKELLERGGPRGCILLDLHLPDARGLEVVMQMLAAAPGAPVVVLTGLAEESAGLAAVAAGAQDYLIKGQSAPDVFSRAIRYAAQRKHAERVSAALQLSALRAEENARLERGLLPTPLVHSTEFEVVARYRPGREQALLGGDFYDIVETPDGTVHAVIGDVSGHGAAAAATGVCLRVAWRSLVLAGTTGPPMIGLLEQMLVAERESENAFATLTLLTFAPDRRRVQILRAGHPGLLLRTAGRVGQRAARRGRPGGHGPRAGRPAGRRIPRYPHRADRGCGQPLRRAGGRRSRRPPRLEGRRVTMAGLPPDGPRPPAGRPPAGRPPAGRPPADRSRGRGGRFRALTVQGWFWLVFGAFAVLVVAAAVVIIELLAHGRAVTSELEFTVLPAQAQAYRLQGALVDQESGIRGYGISGDARFLAPYTSGLSAEAGAARQLRTLIGRKQPMAADLAGLEQAARGWRRTYAIPLIALARHGPLSGRDLALLDQGKQSFDHLRTLSAVQNSHLAAAAARDRAALQRFRTVQDWAFAAILVAFLLAAAAVTQLLHQTVVRPLARLGAAS